jgi:Ni,Fe-hydrogenase III small subunit
MLSNPSSPSGGVVSAVYHACAHKYGFFPQSFVFTHGRVRGCVPLDVQVQGQPRVRRVSLSLFDGSCANQKSTRSS